MADIVIRCPLAEQLRAVAERQKRSVDAVVADLLARYAMPPSDDEVDAALAAANITLPAPTDEPPPLSDEEAQSLADEIGRAGPLSALVIQERSEGP